MGVLKVIHKALDFFFCDRCLLEGISYCGGRPIEIDSKVANLLDRCCPIQHIFKRLPEEPWELVRRIRWPRTWLEGQLFHEDEECGLREF